MYFLALAADYDGTLAHNGVVKAETYEALRRLKQLGRRLILVTGRELPDLRRLFPEIVLFDRVVAENGALIYDPSTEHERLLAPPPPAFLVDRLRKMRVEPVSVGRSIVSTWEPHQAIALNVIRELGLELQIVFNKGAVMILPPGVNKATGLLAALGELDLSPRNVAAVGDAENDHAFLRACGCAAAVANALPAIKAAADVVLVGDHGAGVIELIERLIHEDGVIVSREKSGILVGIDRLGQSVYLEPYEGSVLIAGPSACGKSTIATALTERMAEKQFEFCVLDAEGDYVQLEHAVCVGDAETPPQVTETLRFLHEVGVNVVINTQALSVQERRNLCSTLLPGIARLRTRTGRPHWLVIDEAHQVLAAAHMESFRAMHGDLPTAILVTAFPQALAAEALRTVDVILAGGPAPSKVLTALAKALAVEVPTNLPRPAGGEVLYWALKTGQPPRFVTVETPVQVHKRHLGKYAAGDVGAQQSFYFRGPHKRSNRVANNLYAFLDISSSVDDETWEYHLRAGDYSAWFRRVIGDEDLAREAAKVEKNGEMDAQESRRMIRKAVCRRYIAPGWHADG